MSNVDVAKRFSSAMNNRYNAQSVSLPMFTADSEILFLYYAKTEGTGFVFEELCGVFCRDTKTGEIVAKQASDYFTDQEMAELAKPQTFGDLRGQEALTLVNKYYDLHELLWPDGFVKESSEKRRELLKRYLYTFSLLIPESSLRRVYSKIGHSMFSYIEDQTGKAL